VVWVGFSDPFKHNKIGDTTMSEYSFHVDITDTSVAFDCEADRAEREKMTGVAKRQRANALHVRNAYHHMQALCPEGYRVQARIVVEHVPDVNAYLLDEHRPPFVGVLGKPRPVH
jgi:hypothetical protein